MADPEKDKRMNRLLALFAFLVFAGFLGVLVMGVPSPDLIVIVLLTARPRRLGHDHVERQEARQRCLGPVIWIPRRCRTPRSPAPGPLRGDRQGRRHAGTAEEIVAMSARVDGMIPCHSERFSAEVVARLDPRLRIVANHSVGTDHCDLPALKARGIAVTNTPGVLSDATAELAMMLMLGAARHAVTGDRIVRSGAWDSWSPAFLVGKQVTGARLGIIGMGGVGRALARKARGFDMEIHYHNRRRLPPRKRPARLPR
jgi:hypothetical protein